MPLLTPTATALPPLRRWRTTALCAALVAMAGAALRCHTDPEQIATAPGCSATLLGPEVYLHAPAQQVLLWQLDGGTHAHRVRLFGPDGQLLRQWPAVHNGRQEIVWVTPSAGRYHLQADNPFFDTTQAGAAPVVGPWPRRTCVNFRSSWRLPHLGKKPNSWKTSGSRCRPRAAPGWKPWKASPRKH